MTITGHWLFIFLRRRNKNMENTLEATLDIRKEGDDIYLIYYDEEQARIAEKWLKKAKIRYTKLVTINKSWVYRIRQQRKRMLDITFWFFDM